MKYKKFRELVFDPYCIKFKKIKIKKILNYMPAGNDVIECTCNIDGLNKIVFVKIERSRMADFASEVFNLKKLQKYDLYTKIPKLLEYGFINEKRYIVLSKINGKRLSEILISNDKDKRKKYLMRYGSELAKIHNIDSSYFLPAKQRIINDAPNGKDYNNIDNYISKLLKFLNAKKPNFNKKTFIHGDFHYANILWKSGKISGVLDYEYSGKGFKEQDIAWSLVLRPGQRFLDCYEDIKFFLDGYKKYNNYDSCKLKWCLINAYCHFYLMNIDNLEYINKIKKLISIIIKL